MQPPRASKLPFAFAALALVPAAASAYTLKTSSSGAPVHWTSGVELVPAFASGLPGVSPAAARAVTETSAATWEISLVGTGVGISVAATTAAAAPHVDDGINTVRWAVDTADPDIEHGVLALTFVAYRVSDGVIEDADVVMNAADFAWTTATTGCNAQYDLENALTHEVGHALGLAHSLNSRATMFATGVACEITKRDLTNDDLAGLDAIYPPTSGCSAGGSGGWGAVLVAGFAVGLVRVRRRRWSPRDHGDVAAIEGQREDMKAWVEGVNTRRAVRSLSGSLSRSGDPSEHLHR